MKPLSGAMLVDVSDANVPPVSTNFAVKSGGSTWLAAGSAIASVAGVVGRPLPDPEELDELDEVAFELPPHAVNNTIGTITAVSRRRATGETRVIWQQSFARRAPRAFKCASRG